MSGRKLALAALAVTALLTAGCGAVARVTEGNPAQGKALFKKDCGSCHVLENAGTKGLSSLPLEEQPPNLDNAFSAPKEQGFDITTITDVVRGQIAYPDSREGTICRNTIKTKLGKGLSCVTTPGMLANLVHGQDAADVAVYVALCADKPKCDVRDATYNVDTQSYQS